MSSRNYIADGKGVRGGLLEFISTDMNGVGIFFWEEEHQSSSLVLVFLSFYVTFLIVGLALSPCEDILQRFGTHRASARELLYFHAFFFISNLYANEQSTNRLFL